jgi:hypothetical protein
MRDRAVTRSSTGTPQGGVISPVLANIYLHRLDRCWQQLGSGVPVRYPDDLLVMCHIRAEAEAALMALRAVMVELGFRLKDAKTRIVHLREGGEGLDFLGFHHRWVRARRPRHVTFLARWPARQAMQRARDRIREPTDRKRLLLPVEVIVQDINTFLRGWAGYFRHGNSAHHFDAIGDYAARRLALLVTIRHQQRRSYGWSVLTVQSPTASA